MPKRAPIHDDPRNEYRSEARNRNLEEIGLPAEKSGEELVLSHIPIFGLLRSLGRQADINKRLENPEYLHNTAGKGLETNFTRGDVNDTFGRETDAQMMSEGGIAGMDETKNPSVGHVEIPEDIKEYVEKAHKAIRESRPDENWRIRPADADQAIAPYKRDDEESPEGQMPHYDDGGLVQPFDVDGGGSDTVKMNGQGVIAPPISLMAPPEPSEAGAPTDEGPGPEAESNPMVPRGTPPAPAAPATTDQDFMDRANKMLGLNPQDQAGFLKLLGSNAQKGQIGAGLAGIGDAIASGGTLGKVNPGALNRSEDIIQGKTKEGLEGMQTIRGNQEKAQELSDKLESRDPNSPLSKWAQKAYAGIGKKIGLNLSNASAAMIGDVSGKGVEALKADYEQQLKTMGLDLQKKQVEATIGNQKAEREIAREGRQGEAAKTLADRGILKTLANAVPGTAGHAATEVLENQAKGFGPDVLAYSQKHGISPEEAQAIKDKRTGGK